jgi:hypothetical protein
VTRLVPVVFAVLVAATFAAFFVAQRLKNQPAVIAEFQGGTGLFSPNRDGRSDRARMNVQLREDDQVSATVVDADGDRVRRLVEDLELPAYRRLFLRWDGMTDARRRAPDGTYRVRLNLRRQGRSITLPQNVVLDTTPPRPRVLSIGPQPAPGPELLPSETGEPARIRFRAPGRRVSVEVWRTDRGPRRVAEVFATPGAVPGGIGTATWDGRVRGRRIGAGTFRVVVRSRDRAGNIGTSAPARSGITLRYLAAQPPLRPVGAGQPITVAVDARGRPFSWTLRRVASAGAIRRSRRTTGRPFAIRAPRGASGAYLFAARTRDRGTQVPVAVDDERDHRVLVVLPAATWQGRNPVDDDGDGMPNTLDRGGPVRTGRVFAGDGLPVGFTESEGPLLGFLDRNRMRYDLTTDLALAAGSGPPLDGHRGVLIAGDARWLPPAVGQALRRFAIAGGTVVSLGTDSLRRTVRQTPRRLLAPSAAAPDDLFGAVLAPVRRRTVDLTVFEDDELQLFAGEEGVFPGVRAWEATRRTEEAEPVASAVTPDGDPVVVAARFGRGLVLRPGVPGFASRLSGDAASAELMRRAWTLLSR